MADTIDLINKAVAETMTPEFVKKQVATRVEKLVVEAVDDALRSYSDIGKQIKEAVKASLQVNDLNLPSYGLPDKIRAYYAAGTRIILDEDAVVTSVGDY